VVRTNVSPPAGTEDIGLDQSTRTVRLSLFIIWFEKKWNESARKGLNIKPSP
jgi:hypothetical protein